MQRCKYCSAFLAENTFICSRCGRDQRAVPQFAPFMAGLAGQNAPTTTNGSQAQSTADAQQEFRQFRPFRHSYSSPAQPTAPAQPYYPQATIPLPPLQAPPAEQDIRPAIYDTRRGGKGAALKVIIAIVAVLVIVGGASVFALMHNAASQSLATKGSATRTVASSNPTQNAKQGSSPVASSSPIAGTNNAHTTKSTSTILTCASNGSHTGKFTFSGTVAGTIALATFAACSSAANACYLSCSNASQIGGHSYYGIAQGKINGGTYKFEFLINPYLETGTYTSTTNTNVVLMQNNYEWESYGATSNRTNIVVNTDGKTGSIRATISMMSPQFDPSNIVVVTGNWTQ